MAREYSCRYVIQTIYLKIHTEFMARGAWAMSALNIHVGLEAALITGSDNSHLL